MYFTTLYFTVIITEGAIVHGRITVATGATLIPYTTPVSTLISILVFSAGILNIKIINKPVRLTIMTRWKSMINLTRSRGASTYSEFTSNKLAVNYYLWEVLVLQKCFLSYRVNSKRV